MSKSIKTNTYTTLVNDIAEIYNFWIRDLHDNGSRDTGFGLFDLTRPLALFRLRSEPALSAVEGAASVAFVIDY